jgi:hypothetical protein
MRREAEKASLFLEKKRTQDVVSKKRKKWGKPQDKCEYQAKERSDLVDKQKKKVKNVKNSVDKRTL